MILILKVLNCLFLKMIIAELKDKTTIFLSMCFVMKMDWLMHWLCYENRLSMYQIKSFLILWICCWYLMTISLIMCISKILTDLCAIKQKLKTKNIFVNFIYTVLVVKNIARAKRKLFSNSLENCLVSKV